MSAYSANRRQLIGPGLGVEIDGRRDGLNRRAVPIATEMSSVGLAGKGQAKFGRYLQPITGRDNGVDPNVFVWIEGSNVGRPRL